VNPPLVIVSQLTLSLHELGVTMQGTTVVLVGDVQYKSEAPLECLTLSYQKDDPAQTHYDYFTCKSCNVNWVCEWCRDGCHKGHDVFPYLQSHRPTFPCCHCVKKGLC